MSDDLLLGVDIGGTFTDIVVVNGTTGDTHTYKELTTPEAPSRGVIAGIRNLFERDGLLYADVSRVVHATTLFTNAIIERKGAVTGLITTEGFRDVLEIGHERKYELYDLFLERPRPLVPRSLRLEVRERTTPTGLSVPLDEARLLECTGALVGQGVESLAIVFLHSYVDPTNEQRALEVIAAHHPSLHVSCSHRISPQMREYERTSTTVANAYVKPLADSYLDELERSLMELGIRSRLFLMLSSGGLTHVEEAKRKPIELLESGPAAGALSAAFYSGRSGVSNVLAFDMGGTTAKLAVVDDGHPLVEHMFEAAREKRFTEGSGLPITLSTIELIEIGAGGGSIAHVSELGLLMVGPQSAGSVPGPACYKRGGADATVTDANLVLGYLDPDYFAGGTIPIDIELARTTLGRLGELTQMSLVETAWGIHNSVNETMASAARVHIAELGRDPRSYALLATGGGGPLHCCQVARKLGISRIICPPSAGVASAVGLLVAPARVDRVQTFVADLAEVEWQQLERVYAALEQDAISVLRETVGQDRSYTITRFADMRYRGQGFELVVELPAGPYGACSEQPIRSCYEAQYRSIFGRLIDDAGVQLINLRVAAQAPVNEDIAFKPSSQGDLKRSEKGNRRVYFDEDNDFRQVTVYDRSRMPAGSALTGPAVIEEAESTLIVPPGARVTVESSGNIAIELT